MQEPVPEGPVAITARLLGDPRKILIVCELLQGTRRFGELLRALAGVSQKTLTAHLRDMESAGLVRRKVHAQVPPRVDYSLTRAGKSLCSVIDAMAAWGERYRALREKPRIGSQAGERPKHATALPSKDTGEERQLVIPFD